MTKTYPKHVGKRFATEAKIPALLDGPASYCFGPFQSCNGVRF